MDVLECMYCGKVELLTSLAIRKYRRNLWLNPRRSNSEVLEDVLPFLKCRSCHHREMKIRTLESEPPPIYDSTWWTSPRDFD